MLRTTPFYNSKISILNKLASLFKEDDFSLREVDQNFETIVKYLETIVKHLKTNTLQSSSTSKLLYTSKLSGASKPLKGR